MSLIRLIGMLGLVFSLPALGDGPPVGFEGAYTLIGQISDDSSLEESTTASVDFLVHWELGAGTLEAYVEGNSSLKDNGVATHLPRSNADAGTALDADRSGRVQLSELRYTHEWSGERSLSVGLLDPSARLDSTRINNDENLQFLGASFVNNPTIEFPDYTFGFTARLPAERFPTWNLVLTSSNGIADNPNLSYSQLLNVTEDQKGLFAAAESSWHSEKRQLRAGVWLNTADHQLLDGTRTDADNYGVFTTMGSSWGRWSASLRLGAANRDVSLAGGFASISAQYEAGTRVLGAAASRTWISHQGPTGPADYSMHFECYLRFRLARELYLTPSFQYLVNGGFDSSGPSLDEDVAVYSLRLHHVFYRRD